MRGWIIADAASRPVRLYGPWWSVFPRNRQRFPWQDFCAVRRRMRTRQPFGSGLSSFITAVGLILGGVVGGVVYPYVRSQLGLATPWFHYLLAPGVILAVALHFRLSVPLDVPSFVLSMLEEDRCPRCAYKFTDADFTTGELLTCPECAAVWMHPGRSDLI